MDDKNDYVIITPAKNEQSYIEITLRSVVHQSLRPSEWIIVNDGSNDLTGNIVEEYAKKYPWIKLHHRKNLGKRSPGTGVIQAFYEGFNLLTMKDWRYLVKLDADLELPDDYFESCLSGFETNSKLGIAGGTIISRTAVGDILEVLPRFHVRGATKIYRRECWRDIQGLIIAPGWDTWDEVKAAFHGWITQSFDHIRLIQLRGTGDVEGTWKDFLKNGKANYICGYHPLFMVAKCFRRLLFTKRPISGLALFYGYISAAIKSVPQVHEKEIIKYLRNQQLRRLIGRPSIWN